MPQPTIDTVGSQHKMLCTLNVWLVHTLFVGEHILRKVGTRDVKLVLFLKYPGTFHTMGHAVAYNYSEACESCNPVDEFRLWEQERLMSLGDILSISRGCSSGGLTMRSRPGTTIDWNELSSSYCALGHTFLLMYTSLSSLLIFASCCQDPLQNSLIDAEAATLSFLDSGGLLERPYRINCFACTHVSSHRDAL
ncbi:hypothetical protein CH063_09198 [Colletotrichum higginsianum]|uniref:Uncharacterized protein n=1 Tax=Colletotrichum higginsianum (strain IMI 349063) TaxID=759273 RepID=H1VCN9_COLHI|nr:hypothetical protein CH063_09198 [Colletotrichum higginsianum]